MDICSSVATTVIPCLACKAWEELRYLCKYESYVRDFKNEQGKLSAEMKKVKLKIDKASKRNETLVDPRVQGWLERVDELLREDTQPTKCFGLCMNCCSQIARAKDLDSWTNHLIPKLITEVQEFDAFAHAVGVPGMEFHPQNFMPFKSREAKFEELKKELEDDNNYMIGLQGFGGTGKSTMAIEVGKQVENTNSFDRVMFISVSTPVDKKRIQDDIVKKLELQLEEEKLLTHAEQIWNRIASAGKVLIILDDVWEKLDLENLGIQPGFHRKGRCTILLTTCDVNVCTNMECQKKIKLEELDENDALNLFLYHVDRDCHDDLKKVVVDIVNECGRLPVIVVAMAKSLKDWPAKDWHCALIALRSANEPSSHGIFNQNMTKFYNSLKLSYNYLKDEQAQVLLLLCSIFPKAYEIPIELLSRIATGLGLFGEAEYDATRSQVCVKKNRLINSSLLSKAGEECVKMHDLIREVAMEIANEEIQVIMKSNMNLKENIKYSSWITNGFPNCFNGSKLKVLLAWINANDSLEVPDTVFAGMKSLRVLLLHSKIEFGRTLALSLPKSIQSLKDIRTLCLTNWELGDISMLIRNLKDLESLELTNCSILELPNGISELGKLRFLCLMRCSLEKNNPFEVIANCSKLEELYYISNEDHMPIDTHVPQINIPLPQYQIYHIDGSGFSEFDSCQLDTSVKTSFKPTKLQRMFSKEIIKSLAARAEILELEGGDESSWSNLLPDIVSIEDEATKDLIKLSLKTWSKMKCLIHTKHLQLTSSMAIFRKLAELQLVEVDVREICNGPYPHGFLNQLEKLELRDCKKLESTLLKDNLELGNLKSIEIAGCSMSCLFHPSTAQSLRELETLKIAGCSNLKYIIRDMGSLGKVKVDDKDPNPRSHDSMFQKLKLFNVEECDKLEFMLPICFCDDFPTLESVEISRCENLKYMFGQYPEEMQKENILCSLKVMSILEVPSFFNIYPDSSLPQKSEANTSEGSKAKYKSPSCNVSCGPLCCFMPKSKATNEDESSTSKATQSDHTSPQDKYAGNRAHGIFTPPLYPSNLTEMTINGISNLRLLFSVSIASSMLLLEKLEVFHCDELEHVVMEDVDGHHHHMNSNSIFPKLRTIKIIQCHKLEYVFPVSCSTKLVLLESVDIQRVTKLEYVFGKSGGDDKSLQQNQTTKIHLPALKKLSLEEVPKMVSMCPENYDVEASSLEDVNLDACPQLPINSFVDVSVEGHEGQEQVSRKKVIGMRLCNLRHLSLASLDMVETIYDLERLQVASPVNSSLKTLSLENLDGLRNICVGPKNLQLSFQNLFKLGIDRCDQMKFVLPASILRSLPCLRHLEVSHCGELERIIEDDNDDEECCFPNLLRIFVNHCDRLKRLFSISTCRSFPQLSILFITDAPELEQVFGGKQGATQELHINHVFPMLSMIFLADLPKLHTICPAIDFQTVICQVEDCPKLSLTSTDNSEFIGVNMGYLAALLTMDEDDAYKYLLNRAREVAEKIIIKRDRPAAQQNNGSSNEMTEASVEDSPKPEEAAEAGIVKDSEQTNNKPAPFASPSQIESPQQTLKSTFQEGSKSDEVLRENQIMIPESSKPSPTAFVLPSEKEHPHDNMDRIEGEGKRITLDQQELPNTEPDMLLADSQKNTEASVGETSNKVAMSTRSITTTETISPLPQIATSSTETKAESSKSDHLDIYITDSAQDENKVIQAETCMPHVSKQLENDDLMILLQIMEEGAEMEVGMPYASKITDHEDDSEVTKALADLEASMKLGLNEIASSEESKLCLENALNTLSSHCSDDGLKAIIHSLQQEIQTVLFSFKLEQKQKLMTEQRLQRKRAGMTLLSEIQKTQNSMIETQKKAAELKEQIFKLQTELDSKENEIKECDNKLLSLEKKKKESVSDTIEFIKESEPVKKEMSQLENVDSNWSSCVANLKKTSLLLGVHLNQKL